MAGAMASVVASTGCGPVTYIVAINDAAQAVEEARQVGAAETAGYDYWLAVEHLAKAREFAGEAEYQAAMDMAETAETSGHRARDLARTHPSGPSLVPTLGPLGTVPDWSARDGGTSR